MNGREQVDLDVENVILRLNLVVLLLTMLMSVKSTIMLETSTLSNGLSIIEIHTKLDAVLFAVKDSQRIQNIEKDTLLNVLKTQIESEWTHENGNANFAVGDLF